MSEVKWDDDGLELLAALVGANVDHAAALSNQLLAAKDAELRAMAEALTALYAGIAGIPEMYRTVYLEGLLTLASVQAEHAYRLLKEQEPSE